MYFANIVLFIICKDTKFQSNSQHDFAVQVRPICCLSSAKIQNFKAIHNPKSFKLLRAQLFIICKDTKFQSNSQQGQFITLTNVGCLSSAKIQNFKAIHNYWWLPSWNPLVVYHLQRYKISKQFTTAHSLHFFSSCCLSSAKIQNFKAIHN